jgi:hypothetical protein
VRYKQAPWLHQYEIKAHELKTAEDIRKYVQVCLLHHQAALRIPTTTRLPNKANGKMKGQLSIFHFLREEYLMAQLAARPAQKQAGQPCVM